MLIDVTPQEALAREKEEMAGACPCARPDAKHFGGCCADNHEPHCQCCSTAKGPKTCLWPGHAIFLRALKAQARVMDSEWSALLEGTLRDRARKAWEEAERASQD